MIPAEADMILNGPTDDRELCKILAKRRIIIAKSRGTSTTIFKANDAQGGYLSNIKNPTITEYEEALHYVQIMIQKLDLRLRMEISDRLSSVDSCSDPLNDKAFYYYKRRFEEKMKARFTSAAPPDWYRTFGPLGIMGPQFLKNYPFFPESIEFTNPRIVKINMWRVLGPKAQKSFQYYRFTAAQEYFGGRNV